MTIPSYKHQQRKATSTNFLRRWVRSRGADEPEPEGHQVRLAPSLPSLRESPLSGPRAGGNRDPQPLALPKSHPTRQPLSTADSAVGTSLVVRRAAAAQRARAALAEEGSPSRAGQEGEEGEAGWRRLRAAGRAKRKGAGEGRARSCANCRRQRRRSGHCTTSLSHSFRHCGGCRGCYCGVRGAERGRCPVWTQEREGWRTGGEEDWRRAPAATDGGASGRGCGPGSEKGESQWRMPGGWGEGGREGQIGRAHV